MKKAACVEDTSRISISVRLPFVASRAVQSEANPQPNTMLPALGSESIRAHLDAVERALALQLRPGHDCLASMLGHVANLGGKRLRPALLLLSAQVFDDPTDEAVQLAVVVELLHTATLLHDDVLDGASMRRMMPTVHESYGVNSCILLGDYLFTRAYRLAASCRSTYPAQLVASCATQLCEGELRQQATVDRWSLDEEEYIDVLRQKTAELCAACCRLGAWTQHASTEQLDALESFGRYLGIAFQLFDDWLDIWGSAAVGKSLGTDLAQRKPTLPLIRLLSTATTSSKQSILGALDENSEAKELLIRQLLDRSDASEYTLASAQRLVALANDSLDVLPRGPAVQSLRSLAGQLGPARK